MPNIWISVSKTAAAGMRHFRSTFRNRTEIISPMIEVTYGHDMVRDDPCRLVRQVAARKGCISNRRAQPYKANGSKTQTRCRATNSRARSTGATEWRLQPMHRLKNCSNDLTPQFRRGTVHFSANLLTQTCVVIV